MKLSILLSLAVAATFAAEESCVGRCKEGFNNEKKCQCDSLCKYYDSCCIDFDTVCRTKVARGDVFDLLEEEPLAEEVNTTVSLTVTPTASTLDSNLSPDPEGVTCSGQSFDAFLQLKNGSIYAFRGEYVFELDEKTVMPGSPKLIKDVWGISGPVDAAFTRINCQGKTYLFKGNEYWRFDDNVLDEDYPRNISVGFDGIPDNIDATFALPAPSHLGKEKVYFFKDDKYYHYEFKHQPSHAECISMTKSSPSVLFTSYTNLYCDYDWADLFSLIFQGLEGPHKGPRSIAKDWGITPPIDAAMVSRPFVSPPSQSQTPTATLGGGGRSRKKGRGRGTQSKRSLGWDDFGLDYEERYFGAERRGKDKKKKRVRRPSLFDYVDYTDDVIQEKATPVQKVYFFKNDKYYRVDLQKRQVDYAKPPYPRSIGKYWLGCKEKDLAEKK
ncbi:vitronectin b [Brachyhypopomus gauderio]|uniref:vitronectin b n=1 Tax=Brachyhypopomus gauderio TaxID=698409 RepID=UPI004041204C